jgi:hypothetical protein
MKQTEIEIEKIWIDDKPFAKILGWKNVLDYDEVPDEYKRMNPYYIYYPLCGHVQVWDDHLDKAIHIEDIFTEIEFKKIIQIMRKAGERLAMINKKAKWSGIEVVKI